MAVRIYARFERKIYRSVVMSMIKIPIGIYFIGVVFSPDVSGGDAVDRQRHHAFQIVFRLADQHHVLGHDHLAGDQVNSRL